MQANHIIGHDQPKSTPHTSRANFIHFDSIRLCHQSLMATQIPPLLATSNSPTLRAA